MSAQFEPFIQMRFVYNFLAAASVRILIKNLRYAFIEFICLIMLGTRSVVKELANAKVDFILLESARELPEYQKVNR